MSKKHTYPLGVIVCFLLLMNTAAAQVASTYTFSQGSNTYTPLVAAYPSTPANIFDTAWDDNAYTGYTLPFNFFYNGILYPAGTVLGLDTDAWLVFNPGTMTGQTSGGSWVSTTQSDGVYLYGSANNNGFAGFNADLHRQPFATITGNLSIGSNVVSGISGTEFDNLQVGTRLISPNIPNGTVITSITGSGFTMSADATATVSNASITPAASIFGMTTGTAPNRKFVIQWTQVKRYSGANNDRFSFQMILEETAPQALKVIYGTVSTDVTTDLLMQVGLRGNSSADYNARTSSASWAATGTATSNTNTVALKKTNVPANGLTFIWTPVCNTIVAPGSITGSSPVCPGTSQTYTLPAVSGATYYTWSYSGTGASFTTVTTAPSNNISFAASATSGTLTITPGNACTTGTAATKAITVTTITAAAISYPSGATYCTSNAAVNVTQTGPTGGTYTAAPAGLTINTTSGQITPATSTQGTYTVTYTYTSSGCASQTTTTTVTIQPVVAVTASSTPATICGGGNAQLNTTITNNTNYSVNAIAYGLLTPSGSPTILWNTTTDDAVSSAVALPFSFSYYGQNITQFTVSTNGFIEMGGASGLSATTAQTIPDAATPNNVIALSWRDLKVDLTAAPAAYIRYFVNGTAPNRIMVVEYNAVSFYYTFSSVGSVTGQIRLYESDNHIEIHVTNNDAGNSLSKTLGIENNTGTAALTPAGRNNAAWNAITPEAWSFIPGGYTYSWSPATFLSSTSIANPVAVSLNTNTAYTVQVTNITTGCSGTANVSVAYANTQILGSSGASRCGNGTVSLTATANTGNTISWYSAAAGGAALASGGTYVTPSLSATTTYYVAAESTNPGSTVVIGSGANTASSYDGIFYHLYGGNQTQFLIRASELAATGLTAGNITQLGIRFSSVSTKAYNGFAISMIQTANTDMSGGLNTGAFTGVYSAASVTPVAGINNFTLSTPFAWNGTSNIIIKICWSNNNTGSTSNYAQSDATAYISCAYYRADSQTPATICGATSSTSTLSSRPQFYITGTMLICSSARTAVTATINPQPAALVMSPATATLCTTDPAMALGFTGGTYSTGPLDVYTQGFETFPAANFASTGAGVAVASNATYYAEGAKSVVLTNGNSLTTTSNNNAYQLNSNINLSSYASAVLSFKHICALENSTTTYDAGYVQYSSDGGSTWTTFPSANYTGSGTLMTTVNSTSVTGTIFSTKSYSNWISQFTTSGSSPGAGPAAALWKTETITVPAAALTASFRIRFLITSDATTAYYGWFIDDIKITVPGTATASVVWSPLTGLYTDAAATTAYTGAAATSVYAKPTATTTYTATGTAPGGCTSSNTTVITVKPGNTWLGVNSNWSDPVNWCPGVPTISTDVTIPSTAPNMPILNAGTGTVKNITINSGASLTVSNATMKIAGVISATNAITAASGTIELSGSTAQSISGSSFTNRSIRNLIASNSVNVSSTAGDSLKITGTLSFGASNKNFASGDNIILVSNATGTARIADITNNGTLSGNSFTGKFVVQRYIPARRAWRLMTAPISAGAQTINQAWQEGVGGTWSSNPAPGYGTHITGGPARTTAQGFDQGPNQSSIYGYTGTGWTYLPATTSELVSSREGWMLFVRGSRAINLPTSTPSTLPDNTVLRPTGTIRFGTQSTITNSAGGFMVVGNPYPSPINFKTINKTGVIGGMGGNNAYTLWDPSLAGSAGVGAFVTFSWNSTTSTYDRTIVTGGGSSSINTNGMIPSGSAFLINQSAGGTITIAEKDKDTVVYTPTYLFRPVTTASSLRLSLYLFDQDGSKAITEGALITFHEQSNTAVDVEDAIKLPNIKENFSIARDGQKIAIERRNLLQPGDTIFFKMWNMKLRSYLLELALTNLTIPDGQIAYLEDTYLHTKTALNISDTTAVNFDITADAASSHEDRFRIVLDPPTVVPVNFVSIKAYEHNRNVIVEWKVENEINIRKYDVEKSVDGIHFEKIGSTVAGGGNTIYSLPDEHPVQGTNYYRIKSMDNNGYAMYSRIVKVVMGKKQPAISIYPNPVTDNVVTIQFNNKAEGVYTAKLYSASGQLVFTGQVFHSSNSSAQTLRFDAKPAAGTYQLEIQNKEGNREICSLIIQ